MLMMTLQLHHAQHHIAELDLVPAILGVGLAAGDDEIGTKPVHREWLGQAAIEVGQGLFRD